MVSTIYVVRHGLRANDLPSPTGIDGDVRCSIEGEKQILELAEAVPQLDPPVQKVYSSPFYRCLQTITPSAAALGLKINVETGLGEHYHLERPTHPVPLSAARSSTTFPHIDTQYVSRVSVPKTGESKDMLWDRVGNAMNAIVEASTGVQSLIICTHAAVKIAIGHVLAGVEVRSGTCSMDRYDLQDGAWKCVLNGDTSYLKLGEQMHWDFSLAVEAGSVQDELMRKQKYSQAPESNTDVPKTTILIPLDLGGGAPIVQSSTTIQVADLDKPNPLVQLNDIVYQGSWQKMVGTEVFTTPAGEYIGKTRDKVVLQTTTHEPIQHVRLQDRIKEIDAKKKAQTKDRDGEPQAETQAEAQPGAQTQADTHSEAAVEALAEQTQADLDTQVDV